jgi:hypothetical protein
MALPLPQGELAAISVPVPTQRYAGIQPQLEKALRIHDERLRLVLARVVR